MSLAFAVFEQKSRLKSLIDHFSTIEDPREAWRAAHPLVEVLLLVVCGTMADCDDYEAIAAWGASHLAFLRRYLAYDHGVPGAQGLGQSESARARARQGLPSTPNPTLKPARKNASPGAQL